MTKDVEKVYRWSNGMLMVFDARGEQIADLQGEDSLERQEAIRARSDERTEWFGFAGAGLEWGP